MIRFIAVLLCSVLSAVAHAQDVARLYGAASLTNVLTDIGSDWKQQGHSVPTLVFASSGTLAKQIVAGAPADIFASADGAWMDSVEKSGALLPSTRVNVLGNSLVLIAPKGRGFDVKMDKGFDFSAAFKGKLCTGEPGAVPVGTYARTSLQSLGWWDAIRGRVVGTDDVRTALAFVERGECAAGIVYATDAAISDEVQVLGTFPESTHPPIVYPFALLKDARPDARALFAYLKTARAATVFQKYGFTVLAQ